MKKIHVLLILTFLMLTACGKVNVGDDVLDSYSSYLKILNEDANADIIVLGNTTNLDGRLNYRTIDEIKPENFQCDDSHGYQALVIIDLDDAVEIDDVEFEYLSDYMYKQNKDIMYFGKKYLAKFNEILHRKGGNPDEYGLGMYGCFPNGEHKRGIGVCSGVWTTYHNEILEQTQSTETLTMSIVSELSMCVTGEAYEGSLINED